jgi:hypothetical protein
MSKPIKRPMPPIDIDPDSDTLSYPNQSQYLPNQTMFPFCYDLEENSNEEKTNNEKTK